MDSELQEGAVGRSRRWMLVFAAILVFGVLGAGAARADIYVHVMNCVDSTTVKAEAFDAKDSVEAVAASSKDVSTGDNEQLHCAGEGKGFCQMELTWKGSPERCYGVATNTLTMNLDSGKWAVVKGIDAGTACYPEVETVDSQPASCQAVCGNCLD